MTMSFKSHIVAAAVAALPGLAMAADFGPIIDPAGLEDARQDPAVLILDIRTGKVEDTETSVFEAGHIPGAQHAPYNLFRGPKDNPGQLVTEDQLTDILRGLGATLERPTVIVHAGASNSDFGAAARVYWTLKSSGVSQLAILNGGLGAWTKAKLPLRTGPAETVTPSDIEVEFADTWLATTDDVQAVVAGERAATLLDARPEAFWKGNAKHKVAARPGTLPQSRVLTHSQWFDSDDSTLIDLAKAESAPQSDAFQEGAQLVSFCNTGHWAATNWFVLSELAGQDAKLYPESMVGWAATGNEMQNVPGAMRNLWNRVTGKY